MWGSAVAELIKLVRRPAVWLLFAVGLVSGLIFTYLVPYAAYAGGTSGIRSNRGLPILLPDHLVGNSLGGLPIFLGAIAVILGVLTAGSEYSWGTWKTVLTQGPSRLAVYAGKLAALAVLMLMLVLSVFSVGTITSTVIALIEDQPLDWPAITDLATGIGAGWLVASMWAAFGVVLAVSLRGVALAIGLGLVWMLAIQNLLAVIAAPLLDWVAQMQKGLPGPNAGSLVSALGSSSDVPGVAAVVGASQATLVIAAYLAGFVAVGAALLHRRDVV